MSAVFLLYEVFSANLALYRKEYSGRFVCPLCLRTFSRDQIRSDLSKAHIIPRFLGGKDWTLSCKTCNNKVGTEIEGCEAERANYSWALSGDGNETTRAEIWFRNEQQGGVIGPVQADMRAEECGEERRVQLYAKPQGSNPAAWKLFNRMPSDGALAGQRYMEVRFRVTRSSKRANLTYVHAAYLLMFHQFGYEWVFTPGAELIRKQIMSPDEPIILPLAPALSGLPISDNELGVLLAIEPADFRSFVVVLPLIRGWPKRQAVWMPLFGCPYEQPPQRNGVELTAVRVPDHHQSLHERDSHMQGSRFVLDHFAYDAPQKAE